MKRVTRNLLVTGGTLVNIDRSNVAGTQDNTKSKVVSNDADREGLDKDRDITHTLHRSFLHRDKIEGEMDMERVAREVTEASILATGVRDHTKKATHPNVPGGAQNIRIPSNDSKKLMPRSSRCQS